MEHYICTGSCKGVSEITKSCGTEGCAKKNQPLLACNCEDMTHDGIGEREHTEEDAVTADDASSSE